MLTAFHSNWFSCLYPQSLQMLHGERTSPTHRRVREGQGKRVFSHRFALRNAIHTCTNGKDYVGQRYTETSLLENNEQPYHFFFLSLVCSVTTDFLNSEKHITNLFLK